MLAVSLDFRWPPRRARIARRMHIACFPRKHGRSTRPIALARRERFRDTPTAQTDEQAGKAARVISIMAPIHKPHCEGNEAANKKGGRPREAECKNFTLFVNPPSVSHAMKLRARARTTLKWTDEIHREKQNLAVRLACARGSFLHLQAHNKLSLEIASCRPFLSLVSVLSLSKLELARDSQHARRRNKD